jgi:hypothetical protein
MPPINPALAYLQSCKNDSWGEKTRALEPDEENSESLGWSSTRVVWSRGSSIHRIFEFSPPADSVLQACFVLFEPAPSPVRPRQLGENSETAKERQSLFGAFAEPAPPAWQEDRRPIPTADSQLEREPRRPRRALCIVQRDLLNVYFSDGDETFIPTPWPVSRVWPADIGLVIERADSAHHQSPFLYSLREPLDEIRPISSRSPLTSKRDRVVFVSGDREPRLMVTVNRAESALSIWALSDALAGDAAPSLNASQNHKSGNRSLFRAPSTSAQALSNSSAAGVDLLETLGAASSQPIKRTVSADRRQSTARNTDHSMIAREDTMTWDDQGRHEAQGDGEIEAQVCAEKLWQGSLQSLRYDNHISLVLFSLKFNSRESAEISILRA